jgi:capsular exopolysaccharide synthesis family protein
VTRLTEALERARAMAEAVEAVDRAAVDQPSRPDVPGTWEFDSDQMRPTASGEAESRPSNFELPEDFSDEQVEDLEDRPFENVDYPFAKGKEGQTLVVGQRPNNTLVEQYRHLAAALHHAQLRTGARTAMIASAVESEGKTTTAVNVALTLSHSHRRQVLLIDADLRRPSIHSMLHLSNRAGLSETLRTVSPKAKLPLHKISPTLTVMTAGKPSQDPMSLLVSDMMRNFLAEAAQEYDWVIIDTPPVALLSDANLLSSMVDAALLVVRAEATPYPLVRRAVDAIGSDKILGVVLNRAKRSEIAVGYGYYYGYGYNYATARRTPRRWWWPFRGKG